VSRKIATCVFLTLATIGGSILEAGAQETVEGVWKVVRIERDYQSKPNIAPLPSLFIFTKKHYSIVWMPGETALEAFAERWAPTDEEKIQRFGEFVVNTGEYTIDDAHILVRPIIARVPDFIGGQMIYEYEWSREFLVLTMIDESTHDGIRAPWVRDSSGTVHITLARISEN